MKSPTERQESKKCVNIEKSLHLDNNDVILYCNNKSELRESDRCLLSDAKGPVHGECIEVFILNVTSHNITVRARAKLGFKPHYLDIHEPFQVPGLKLTLKETPKMINFTKEHILKNITQETISDANRKLFQH